MTAIRDLIVSNKVMQKYFSFNRGAHLRMYWLRKTYDKLVVVVAGVYMLHLITHTLFADKSNVYIDAWYACMFSSLKVSIWAWGYVVLTIM